MNNMNKSLSLIQTSQAYQKNSKSYERIIEFFDILLAFSISDHNVTYFPVCYESLFAR